MKLSFVRPVIAALFSLAALAAHAEAPFSFADTPGKLPKDVVPLQYAAHLRPDLAARTFYGSETVEIEVLTATTRIMLNAAALQIDSASLAGKDIPVRKLAPVADEAAQTVTFRLDQPLLPGRYQLTLKFHGTINREARGLFHLEYQAGKTEKTMLVTNLAPSDARRLLPTWDEPAFRAAFKLTVDLPLNFKAYSNTPVEKQEKIGGGLQRLSFGLTPRMPSYLLVLVAGELERSAVKQDGIEIGVVTTAGKQPQAAFALGTSKDLLRYYHTYFGQPYALPKLDQIAVPGGFNGAMENWGGIVYHETTLLVDPRTSPESMRKQSFIFNAHEVSHQWFGNLVTMAWWDNLWLNEGFASWMETKASEHFHPEWRAALDSQGARDTVMEFDARKTTRALQSKVETEDEAADAFDDIPYVKGEALVRMLEAWLGEDAFRNGMRSYMASHRMGNTTGADLWAALEKASGKPVTALALDWTMQPGYPLLKVEQACEQGRRRITLSQEQYWLDEQPATPRQWQVPLQLGIVGGKAVQAMLDGPSSTVILPGCEGTLVVDPNGVGYFRVQYDSASFAALSARSADLSDSTRLRLLSDTWSQAQAGRQPLSAWLTLAGNYRGENRAAVWRALASQLRSLDDLMAGTPEQEAVRRFTRDLARPAFDRLGWDEKMGESVDQRALRPLLAGLLIHAADQTVLAQARARSSTTAPPSMRAVLTLAQGLYADVATYDRLLARLMQSDSAEERDELADALCSATDPVLAARTLALSMSDLLPAQITSLLVGQVARAGHAALAWNFAIERSAALLNDQEALGRNAFFPSLVGRSFDAAQADMMEAWVGQHMGPGAMGEARKVGNEIRTRALQRQRLLPQVLPALAAPAA
ncbi:M1 family metallopeptidase [Massilia sp. CF038]|uniref:M1 family metallopeptidase n=1 Tax=Massilia sp. CF038 TaxID=1881045 RepID=UPI000933F125|nr:M1 family metallopeptidase [Massilia sp. CF038]